MCVPGCSRVGCSLHVHDASVYLKSASTPRRVALQHRARDSSSVHQGALLPHCLIIFLLDCPRRDAICVRGRVRSSNSKLLPTLLTHARKHWRQLDDFHSLTNLKIHVSSHTEPQITAGLRSVCWKVRWSLLLVLRQCLLAIDIPRVQNPRPILMADTPRQLTQVLRVASHTLPPGNTSPRRVRILGRSAERE
jgi:hypothetical protein